MVWARHRVLVGEGRVSFWLVGLASLNCSTLIFDTNRNPASGQSPCSRNADGTMMC